MKGTTAKGFLLNVALLITFSFISVALLEFTLRIYYFGSLSYSGKSEESKFWRYDTVLGWAPAENSEGTFSNPLAEFSGRVKFDDKGLRDTGNNYGQQNKSILVVGDSTTVGLEVDDNRTYAAVLEKLLYESGCKHTVYNAGVRGYGTDQAYWRTMALKELQPDLVIYMFTGNDLENNRTIKRGGRVYGKPAYTLSQQGLSIVNLPSQKFEKSFYSHVLYGENDFRVIEGHIQRFGNPKLETIKTFIRENLAIYHAMLIVYDQLYARGAEETEKNDRKKDFQLLGKILEEMREGTEDFMFTSFTNGEPGYTDDLLKLSKDLNIPYVDLLDYFDGNSEIYHWKTDGHWNEVGHATAGLALYEQIESSLCH